MKKAQSQACRLPIPTTEGEFVARFSERGLCGLQFPSTGSRSNPARTPVPSQKQMPPQIQGWYALTKAALDRALAGEDLGRLPPFDFSSGTAFQERVWQTLRRIGPGRTWSYGQVAAAMGRPKAVRAVGGACGANPIPVFVPCHRVVAAGHKLGGFSGGLQWKRLLLAREGVELPLV
jgi:AraC family transcriptional regulator of adaptative response/methylated-DNA-[protein]-cysteine methyltransferase